MNAYTGDSAAKSTRRSRVGAWIEINIFITAPINHFVAPRVGGVD